MAAINTVFRLTDNVTNTLNRINQGFKDARTNIITANQAVSLFNQTLNLLKNVASTVDDLTDSYYKQTEQETKLYTVMRERMDASKQEVNSVKELSKELQNIGIYNDQIILAAAQEAATFVTQKENIAVLLPALANLVAQQYGYSASAENARSAATRMGKVILGNVDGLSRLGYVFNDAEKKMLKTGTEMERVATLANIINANVGNMNEALAKTPQGQLMNTKNAIQDLKEQIGASFVNAQLLYYQMKLAFTRSIANAIDYIKDHAEDFKTMIGLVTVATTIYAGVLTAKAIPAILKAGAAFFTAHAPMIAILATIGAIIGVLTLLGVSVSDVGRVIGGVVGTIYTIIYDIYATVVNFILGVRWIVRNAINGVIGFINIILQKIADIKGFFTGKEVDVKQITKLENGEEGVAFGVDNVEYKGLDDIKNFINKGGEAGAAVDNALGNFFKGLDVNVDVEKTSSGALLVHDESLIDIASDYRELLSKRATQAFNLQYARPFAPSVTIERVDIRKEVDADNVLNRFTSALIDLGSSSLSVAN